MSGRGTHVRAGVGLATTTILYALLAVWLPRVSVLPGFVAIAPADAVPFVAGVALGPVGAAGRAVGFLLARLLQGVAGPATIFGALAQFLFGYLGYRLWSAGRGPARSEGTTWRPRSALAFLGVVVVASLAAASFFAWGLALLGRQPFFPTAPRLLASYAVAAVLLGGPGVLVLRWLRRRGRGIELAVDREPGGDGVGWGPALVALLWFLAGTGLSVGYFLLGLVPAREFATRGLGFVLVLQDPAFGDGGSRLQLVVGAFLLAALLVVIWRRGTSLDG